MNQKVIKFVNQLKNCSLIGRKEFFITFSDLVLRYTRCLYKEGFIQSYKVIDLNQQKKIKILIKINDGFALTSNIKLISTLTKKRYLTFKDISNINMRNKELFFSTSSGIYSLTECKKKRLGGLAVFVC